MRTTTRWADFPINMNNINRLNNMTPTCIHLVRHGEVHNPHQILYGRLPRFRLSPRGLEQARAAGASLAGKPVQAIFSSPLLRARQTARRIGTFFPAHRLRVSSHINEIHTAYEGLPAAEVDARQGDIYTGTDAAFEQPVDIVSRVLKFFRLVRRYSAGKHVVAVTHGDVIVFTMLWAKGFALSPENKIRLKTTGFPAGYPAHASITSFTYRSPSEDERPSVDYLQPWK
jgi:broad specificity phosphatase PhoE